MTDIIRSTTVIGLTYNGKTVIGSDGQVTVGATVMKHRAKKIRKLYNGKSLPGSRGPPPTPSRCSPASRTTWKNTAGTWSARPSSSRRTGAPTST
jgi:hypothetical protein